MGLATSIAVFFVLWWLVLFLTLPFGIRSQWEDETQSDGTDPGAPQKPNILRKFGATTLITFVVFILVRMAVEAEIFRPFLETST